MKSNFTAMARLLRGDDASYAPFVETSSSAVMTGDDLYESIFAPDPFTGVPRSDISIMMSKDTRPEVAQYIRDTLMHPRSGISTDDPDFALATVKSRQETIAQYADRLRELVSSQKSD